MSRKTRLKVRALVCGELDEPEPYSWKASDEEERGSCATPPRTRRRKLLKLGVSRDEVHKASRARKGHPPSLKLWRPGWRMSQMSLVRWAMNNDWLEAQGLPSLEKQWCSIRYPEGPTRSPKPRRRRKGSKG